MRLLWGEHRSPSSLDDCRPILSRIALAVSSPVTCSVQGRQSVKRVETATEPVEVAFDARQQERCDGMLIDCTCQLYERESPLGTRTGTSYNHLACMVDCTATSTRSMRYEQFVGSSLLSSRLHLS